MKTQHIAEYVENFLHPILQILNALINFHTPHVFTVKKIHLPKKMKTSIVSIVERYSTFKGKV